MKKFIVGVFSEPDGKPSYARVFGGLTVFSVVAWVTIALMWTHKLPDLLGAALLVSGNSGVLYAGNKIATAIAGR